MHEMTDGYEVDDLLDYMMTLGKQYSWFWRIGNDIPTYIGCESSLVLCKIFRKAQGIWEE